MPGAQLAVQPALSYGEAREFGLSRGELSGPGWLRAHRNVLLPVGACLDVPLQRAVAAAALLPVGGALGGWAAACVLGCPVLDGRGADGRSMLPAPIVTPPPVQVRHRPGIVSWRSPLDADDLVEINGVVVTNPVRTAFDCARKGGLVEAVVALDALARWCRLDLAAVSAYAARRPGWGGVPTARAALALADARARSAGESRMRLFWIQEAGLPRPLVNAHVLDRAGRLIGIVDLLDDDAGLVGEYDGAGHREAAQHGDDNAREEWLEDLNLVVVRLGAADLRPGLRARSRLRLQAAARRAAARDRSRDRWTVRLE